ncbi:unnamed protein product [Cuscuta epithymum]|uniref:Endonuclease/exonuclease/phosphatase domain-containing protein n=1 Tax=Cuscuta epithymum TaxID=186058 RepID=A0AAV0G1I6_9ASTE|nr:unnamed protein product [Cuscuta epithymum]
MILLNWNTRGLLSSSSRLQSIITQWNISLFTVFEPMVSITSTELYKNQLGFSHVYPKMDNRIWVFWKEDLFTIDNILESDQYVHVKVIVRDLGYTFWLTNVYGKYTRGDRSRLWNNLRTWKDGNNELWVVGGDFNVIGSLDDHHVHREQIHMDRGPLLWQGMEETG